VDTCVACGAANRDGARFCAACGERLERACAACGGIVDPTARFCDRCGTALDQGAGPSPLQARKVVTVVFTDLIDSTRAQEHMDPESVRRWIDRFYAVMRQEIEAHGGRLVKFLGDGVMALFGVPEVQEDDALRAVRAAMAMQSAFRDLVGGSPRALGGCASA
jgi:class 3 adenylate cyclase